MSPERAIDKFSYLGSLFADRVWVGEAFDGRATALGYADDRHVCLISGSRGGKGVGVIVPNLCFWPGSAIIVDPKGENATVTARRRGGGSPYTHAMGQRVRILDPFGEVELPAELKARYNPLDAIDPNSDYAVDDAGRVAAALVVIENRKDPYWEEAARNLIKGVILHVLTASDFEGRRNLVSVRRLLSQGDWIGVERLQKTGEKDIPSSFLLLWSRMKQSKAVNGVVAGIGEQMFEMADKQRSGVLESARTSTGFLDSVPMQRMLQDSDFDLGELKTNPHGLTIYLTLPARYMETHYRWLRLMITLAVGEMERIKGRPATGHPTLFLLDEFAGLKRMEVVEHAAAQAAGFGVKFLFVVQNLPQIEELYEKSWETFLGNSGLKLFFQIDDDFTRGYLARQLGELETTRQTRSGSQSRSRSDYGMARPSCSDLHMIADLCER
jgi:type IV secretory pathway TraG/TraD family ATPase VirD4